MSCTFDAPQAVHPRLVVGLSVFFRSEFDGLRLDRAQVVRGLLEPKAGHRCLAALQDALGEGQPEGLIEVLLDDVLAVVVLDLLKGVDYSVQAGECMTIMGGSGSGKLPC